MRTSRVSKETARHFKREADAAAAVPPRRSARTSLARFAYGSGNATAVVKQEVKPTTGEEDDDSSELSELEFGSDIEDAIKKTASASPPYLPHGDSASETTRKRKRATRTTTARNAPRSRVKHEKNDSSDSEVDLSGIPSSSGTRRVRKPMRRITSPSGSITVQPPSDWEEMYALVKEMRISGPAKNAAVDTMGCERLADDDATPRDRRFHTLVALMLSSQTKDTVNAEAMARLKREMPGYAPGKPKGLNLENMLAADPGTLNEMIGKVGFHNNKTKYLKQTAVILRDKFNSDIPPTIDGLTSLPGVGPKMAHLCMSAEAGWNRVEGIGVDVHVHRITNLWGWQSPPSKTPEETRMALQSWLPKDKWREINWLLVGFGQKVCLPVGRKCGECELGLRGLCKSAERKKVIEGRKRREVVKVERVKPDEDGKERFIKMEVKGEVNEVQVKEEVVNEEIPNGVNDNEAQELAETEGVKRESVLAAIPPKVEATSEGDVLPSIETDPVKQEMKSEDRTVSPNILRQISEPNGEAVKQETPIKRETANRRNTSRSFKVETKQEDEDVDMTDLQEAPSQQENEQVSPAPIKRERGSRAGPIASAVVNAEVKREEEVVLDMQTVKQEERQMLGEDDVEMKDEPRVKDEDDVRHIPVTVRR